MTGLRGRQRVWRQRLCVVGWHGSRGAGGQKWPPHLQARAVRGKRQCVNGEMAAFANRKYRRWSAEFTQYGVVRDYRAWIGIPTALRDGTADCVGDSLSPVTMRR